VPDAEEFRVVIDALLEAIPAGADVSAIEARTLDGHRVVIVRTLTPASFVGRRGSVANAIRTALSEKLDDPGLKLNIIEERGPPDDPSPGPPSGVREPRTPLPDSPSTSASIAEPEGT
jgi:ribosomal protein S3